MEEHCREKSPNLVLVGNIIGVLRLKQVQSADPLLEVSVIVAQDSQIKNCSDGVHDDADKDKEESNRL